MDAKPLGGPCVKEPLDEVEGEDLIDRYDLQFAVKEIC